MGRIQCHGIDASSVFIVGTGVGVLGSIGDHPWARHRQHGPQDGPESSLDGNQMGVVGCRHRREWTQREVVSLRLSL